MSHRAGRNELCPCGSGKKMKACHPGGVAPVAKNRKILLIGLGVAAVAVIGAATMRGDTAAPLRTNPTRPMNSPVRNTSVPPTQPAGAAKPGTAQPGPAPPGKVWSVEHGHWHDAPGAAAQSSGAPVAPNQNQPVVLNAPQKSATANPAQPTRNVPQPSGIAPPGNVWSPEHGHYHDPPKTQPTGTAQPATQTAPATPPAQKPGPN